MAEGVLLADGERGAGARSCWSTPIRSACATWSARQALPDDYNRRIDGYRRDGTTFKVNLALKGLPRFTCLPEDRGQYGPTIHLLPDEDEVIAAHAPRRSPR